MRNKTIDEIRTYMSRSIPRPALFFDVEVTEHCNLNCKGCGSMAPIAEESFLDLKEYKKDITRLSELSGGVVHHINVLGGEPLLHPQICDILALTREKFPVGNINLVTNGLLVLDMNETFWETCSKNQIILCPTKYPIKVDYEKIKRTAEEKNVRCRFFGNVQDGSWLHLTMTQDGDRNENQSFFNCGNANNCGVLEHGKLYPCPRLAKIQHFNKFFHKNFPVTERDFINIYADITLKDILQFYSHSVPFCRFCNTFADSNTKWEVSKKNIREWT